jgi:hypothetical protein
MSGAAKGTIDHEVIRAWVEERGGKPACVKRTAKKNDIGILRIDFPGYSGEDTLEHISWDEWFDKFEEKRLAMLFQEETAGGDVSRFSKLVSRDTVSDNIEVVSSNDDDEQYEGADIDDGESATTTDREQIQKWVEARGGCPARVKGTGVLRIDYPGYSGKDTLETISWDDWFEVFEESQLAFLFQEKTKSGKPSRFSKLIKRDRPSKAA